MRLDGTLDLWRQCIKRSITSTVFETIREYNDISLRTWPKTSSLTKSEDWSVLGPPASQTTLTLESHNSTLDMVLHAMNFVLEQFETFKEKHKYHPILGPMFDSGQAKMDKYYVHIDRRKSRLPSRHYLES
jgi:hypothetical protein